MHERHEGMEEHRQGRQGDRARARAGTPDLAAIRASAATIADLAPKASGWFPAGTGPDVGKTGAKPEIWQNRHDFAAKVGDFQAAAQAFDAAAARRRPRRDQGALRRPRQGLQGVPRQISLGDAPLSTEPQPKQPVWDLPTRLFHWLLAGADRVQLVVGRKPPHRLAHLVGLRDPDAADVPPAVGFRRKLDRALRQFRPRTPSGAAPICAAGGRGIGHNAARRAERPCACSRRSRSRSGSGLISQDRRRPLRGPARHAGQLDTSDKARDIHELWFNVLLALIVLHVGGDHLLIASAAGT